MRIYGLEGTGQVADIPGAVSGGEQYKRQQEAWKWAQQDRAAGQQDIDERKRMENTVWLVGAAKYALDNWDSPSRRAVLQQLGEEGKRRGILKPDFDLSGVQKADLIQLYQGGRTALGGVDPMPQEEVKQAKGADGYLYYTTGPNKGQRVLPGVQAPEKTDWMDRLEYQDQLARGRAKDEREWQDRREREKAEAAAREAALGDAARGSTKMADIENLRPVFARAKENANVWTTGILGAATSRVPGTPAFDLREDMDTITANLGFDRLQRMREESKTGGALGQVAVRELELLQKTVRSLETSQSRTQFMENLSAVEQRAESAFAAYEAAMQERAQKYGMPEQQPEQLQRQPENVAPEGMIVIDPRTGQQLIKQGGQWVPYGQ